MQCVYQNNIVPRNFSDSSMLKWRTTQIRVSAFIQESSRHLKQECEVAIFSYNDGGEILVFTAFTTTRKALEAI